jgi:hypothetical protein
VRSLKELAERLLWGEPIERRRRGLVRLHDVLAETSLSGKYFMTMGFLLGCVRDGAPIPWDRDFDFGFLSDDLAHFLEAAEKLRSRGYDLRPAQINNDGRITKWAFKLQGVKFEFFQFEKHGSNVRWHYHRRKPSLELTNEVPWGGLVEQEVYGRSWLRPANAEEILTRIYGDWRSPNPGYVYWRDCRATVERHAWTGQRRPWGRGRIGAA